MFRRKKRDVSDNSVETIYPFLNKISQIGWDNLNTVNCQKVMTILSLLRFKIFISSIFKELLCEMSVMGETEEANSVQRTIARMVQFTPTFLASEIGVNDVLEASRSHKCQQFKCVQ